MPAKHCDHEYIGGERKGKSYGEYMVEGIGTVFRTGTTNHELKELHNQPSINSDNRV